MTTLRQTIFWALDAINGGRVREQMHDIAALMVADDVHNGRIEEILRHATSTVPFYGEYEGVAELDMFPVVDKGTIQANVRKIVSNDYPAGRLHTATTSGSTGTPFRVVHDRKKRQRLSAEAIFWGNLAGYQVGRPLFYLKVWTGRNRTSRAGRISRNVIPIDVTRFDERAVADLIAAIRARHRPVSIISYASALEQLARVVTKRPELVASDDMPEIASMVSQSETLSAEARVSLQTAFAVTSYARYGLEELGIVAQQVPGSGHRYRTNGASFFVEVLEESSDRPAAPGVIGRIVVTDLVSKAQPMIRYDTGDLGRFSVNPSGNLDPRWLEVIHGRQADQVYDTRDRALSPLLMYRVWWRYPEVGQYQLIQQPQATYTVRLNVPAGFSRKDEFLTDLSAVLGVDARIALEIADEEFVLSSGKRRVLIGNYRPKEDP